MGELEFRKAEATGRRGMVTASTPDAAEAGHKVLEAGGNAVDAGVAVGFCNTVLEPYLAALGGLGFMLVYDPGSDRVVSVDFNTRAPKAATPDMYRVTAEAAAGGTRVFDVEGAENSVGARSLTVPATLAGLCTAHELYGSLPLRDVLGPATALARDGFSFGWDQLITFSTLARESRRNPEIDEAWLPGGYPPAPGTLVRQPRFARLLARVAEEGPGFVYRGDVAEAIARAVAEGGGLLSLEDLASYSPVVGEPLRVPYRGYDVATTATPGGGVTVLQILRVLERLDLASMGHNSAEYLHVVAEASRQAFADRYSLLGDWEHAQVPLEGMLSASYTKELAGSIDSERASFPAEGAEPWARYLGHPIHDPWRHQEGSGGRAPATAPSGAGETTHFNVVDARGGAVCCTHTPGFQAGVTPPGTGLYLTAAMGWFVPRPGYPNSVAGWKRPLMNMAPLMVLRDGLPVLLEGAPGSRRIIDRNLQVVLNALEFGMGPQEAVGAPTIDASGIDLLFDSRISPEAAEGLRKRGHRVKVVEEAPGVSFFARPSAVAIDRTGGPLRGGVDIFRRSRARGL